MQDIQIPGPFVVLQGVPGDGLCNTMDQPPLVTAPPSSSETDPESSNAEEEWNRECREQREKNRREWLNEYPNFGSPSLRDTSWWCTDQGCVALLDNLPGNALSNNDPRPKVRKGLLPGTVVQGVELFTLRSEDLVPLPQGAGTTTNSSNPAEISPGEYGQIQMLKTDDGGFVVLSVDGYHVLGPGSPNDYSSAKDDRWIWRVMCTDGAWVRHGLSLTTECVGTIPFGALVTVYQRVVNDMALSRLQVEYKNIRGWCSEFLNPLSGQSGTILRPLPLCVPMQVRVVLPLGAVVRHSVELSSQTISSLNYDTVVAVTEKAFSEHPADQCVARLRTADGWISTCLNTKEHEPVVQCLNTPDPAFDRNNAARYHLQRRRIAVDIRPSSSHIGPAPGHNSTAQLECVICLERERSATIVHGETGHVACCLVCARILKARNTVCPVCRLPIDAVIQHFWA